MPFSMCPLCGQTSHLSVGDVKEWYEKYYPQIPHGSLVPGKCFYCWQELKPGDSVVIRKVFSEGANSREGEIGVIKDVFTSEGGQLFVVVMDAGKEIYFARAQLRKLREGEVQPTRIID